jgi:hypothetical protein
MSAYCQTEAGASLSTRTGFINSVEPLENERYIFGGNADSGVRDGKDSHLPFAAKRDRDSPGSGSISDGIVHKVHEQFSQSSFITFDR